MGTLSLSVHLDVYSLIKFKMPSISGTFSHVCSKESADFYVKCGFPAEMAEKMIGMKLSMKTVEFAEGKLACQMCFEGHPELGSCFLAYEGVANNLNLPHMDGKWTKSTLMKELKRSSTKTETSIQNFIRERSASMVFTRSANLTE